MNNENTSTVPALSKSIQTGNGRSQPDIYDKTVFVRRVILRRLFFIIHYPKMNSNLMRLSSIPFEQFSRDISSIMYFNIKANRAGLSKVILPALPLAAYSRQFVNHILQTNDFRSQKPVMMELVQLCYWHSRLGLAVLRFTNMKISNVQFLYKTWQRWCFGQFLSSLRLLLQDSHLHLHVTIHKSLFCKL